MDQSLAAASAARAGERWVLRTRLPDGSATDVTGWVQRAEHELIQVATVSSGVVTLERAAVIAARRLPLAYGGPDPRRTSPAVLEHLAVRGWHADAEPLGEWLLRAGGGFTGRANSCLAVGDPGVPFAVAAEKVIAYAEAHAIPPRVQVITGSSEDRAFRQRGWRDVYVPTTVLVLRLASLLGSTPLLDAAEVSETLTPEWEAAYAVSRPPGLADPAVVRRILDSGSPRAFGSLRGEDPAGPLVAIGRGHLAGDWLGVAAVWTDPEYRRGGRATRILHSLGVWAARRGARSAYLQVATDNRAAQQAYERLGFVRHHDYHYLAPLD